MTRERPRARRLAAAAITVTVVTSIAWLALARSGAGATAPTRATATVAGNPLPAASLSTAARFPVSGVVVERLPAGPYTYLRVRPAAGGDDLWLAMMAGSAPAGDRVDAVVMGKKVGFHSRRLGRSFDVLLFAAAALPTSKGNQP